MKLWLISQSVNIGYDVYDSAVVAAETAEQAQKIHPDGYRPYGKYGYKEWTKNAANIHIVFIGDAKPGTEEGVILASYNAG